MSTKKALILAAVGVGLVGCVIFYAGFAGKGKVYQTEQAVYGSISEAVDTDGTVKGEREITYYAQVTAPVSQVDLQVGDEVSKDAALLTYDTYDLEKAYTEAILQVEASESGMKAKIQESSKNAAKYAKANADEEAYKLLYAWSRADSNYVNQDQYTESYQIKCQSDSLQKSIADKTKQSAEKTAALAKMEDHNSEEYRKLAKEVADLGVDVASLQKELAALPNGQLTPSENAHLTYDANLMEDISRNWTQAVTDAATAEGQILNEEQKKQIQKTHEITELSADNLQETLQKAADGVLALENGIVTSVHVEKGAVVNKGTPLFTVESTDSVKVDVELSKYDIAKVEEGQKADINIAGSTYAGTVSEIKRLAVKDGTDKAKVIVSVHVDQPDDGIILGLEADVVIHAHENENALLLPVTAFYSDDQGDYCYAIVNGIIVKKYVETGIESGEYIEIKNGLAEQDVVITDAITDDAVGQKASY
ncbi:MAG: HlyD family efflux transporter periplasmic adaptor subunit [Clostridia bacterium]|nr:HlyD family efflux transporter periplasmic adaptor subunit [Clostridia bacterium]